MQPELPLTACRMQAPAQGGGAVWASAKRANRPRTKTGATKERTDIVTSLRQYE